MRTKEEIIERALKARTHDFLGFELTEYIRALDKETLEGLRGTVMRKDANLSEWTPDLTNDEAIKACCIDYMPFAWEKANNCRGISAMRSLMHYKAWLWMLGQDDFESINDDYEHYGKAELRRICEFLDIDADQWDDGIRVNSEEELYGR